MPRLRAVRSFGADLSVFCMFRGSNRSWRAGAEFLRVAVASAALAACAAATSAHAGQPAPRELRSLLSALEATDAVVEGASSRNHVLYVFVDANCWYCHLAWKPLQPYENAGLQVRWVPVAYQKDSSVTRAAAIMLAKDRVAALRENESRYRAESYDGGVAPAKAPAEFVAQVAANTKLMEKFGAPGTPLLVWKDQQGAVRTKVGMPRLSQLPAITGLPAQENSDPELVEFR
jgi:thiol:disulfide interchange protein DsbG